LASKRRSIWRERERKKVRKRERREGEVKKERG
jgi:hypothetical protein